MENFENKKIDFIGQTKEQWMNTGKFRLESINVNNNKIRCALVESNNSSDLLIMAGGIPRDPDRQRKLPLINKLYGNLALKMTEGEVQKSSLLYNQPATGESDGDSEKETIKTRIETLVGLVKYFRDTKKYLDVSLLGTSAAGYMAVRAIRDIEKLGLRVSKLVLLSPACYPQNIEDVPYGEKFTEIIRQNWDISQSPIFKDIEDYARNKGSVYINFFEKDDSVIPSHIQEYYRKFLNRLSDEGLDVKIGIISGVEHNFHRIGCSPGDRDIIDNDCVRSTANDLKKFLLKK